MRVRKHRAARATRSQQSQRWREQRSFRMLLARLSPKPPMHDNTVYVNSAPVGMSLRLGQALSRPRVVRSLANLGERMP